MIIINFNKESFLHLRAQLTIRTLFDVQVESKHGIDGLMQWHSTLRKQTLVAHFSVADIFTLSRSENKTICQIDHDDDGKDPSTLISPPTRCCWEHSRIHWALESQEGEESGRL